MKNKRNLAKPNLVRASIKDYNTIQNLARFYVYDMSRYCGFISPDWACPSDGLFESFDFSSYFNEPKRFAFLVKIENEIAGFVLIKKIASQYKIGEFFIIAKFQSYGIAELVAHQIWRDFKGEWELSVIPENIPALKFWRKAIRNFTGDNFNEELIMINYDAYQPKRFVFSFSS